MTHGSKGYIGRTWTKPQTNILLELDFGYKAILDGYLVGWERCLSKGLIP
jgi:hypothetical protein